jgi:hypothetical protein
MLTLIPVGGDRSNLYRAFKQFQLIIFQAAVWLDLRAESVSAMRLPWAATHLTKTAAASPSRRARARDRMGCSQLNRERTSPQRRARGAL